MSKKLLERNKQMKKLYKETELSYTEVGKIYKISRQRVHQILTGYESPSHKVNG